MGYTIESYNNFDHGGQTTIVIDTFTIFKPLWSVSHGATKLILWCASESADGCSHVCQVADPCSSNSMRLFLEFLLSGSLLGLRENNDLALGHFAGVDPSQKCVSYKYTPTGV